jgi:hypothetical protein
MPYNLISCAGFCETTGWVACSPCLKAKLGIVILFFILAILRKWGGEEVGLSFSFLFALIGGLLPYFIVVIIFGSFKIAMVVGILGGLAGGYLMGMVLGDEGGGSDYG